MYSRTPRPTRLVLALAAGGALVLGACGSDGDGGGGGSTEAFCEQITQLAESSDDTTDEQNLAALQGVADAAPSEISDEMDELVSAFEELQSFDPEAASEEQLAEFLEIANGLDEASSTIEAFALENCPDIPTDLFETE
jgi:hypothetical protein